MLYAVYCVAATLIFIVAFFITEVVADVLSSFFNQLWARVAPCRAEMELAKKNGWRLCTSDSCTFLRFLHKVVHGIPTDFWKKLLWYFLRCSAPPQLGVMLLWVKSALLRECRKCFVNTLATYNLNTLEEIFYGFTTCLFVLFAFYYMCIYSLLHPPAVFNGMWVVFSFYSSWSILLYKSGRDQSFNLIIRSKLKGLPQDYFYYKYFAVFVLFSLYFVILSALYIDFFFIDVIQHHNIIAVKSATPPLSGSYKSTCCWDTLLTYVWEIYPKHQTTYFDGALICKSSK